jgi:hypothetical protein
MRQKRNEARREALWADQPWTALRLAYAPPPKRQKPPMSADKRRWKQKKQPQCLVPVWRCVTVDFAVG